MPKETISDGLNRCSLGIMEVYLLHTKSGNKALISPCVVNLALPERCGSERSEVGTNKGGSEREAPLVRMLGNGISFNNGFLLVRSWSNELIHPFDLGDLLLQLLC